MAVISKAYEPAQSRRNGMLAGWPRADFKADPVSPKPAYSIVMPPPNVTGVLTLGHVLNNTIQDILARRARMLGKEVLWLPGTDHAGIGTQTVVERHICANGKEDATRSRARGIPPARLGMEGQTRRHHYRATEAARLLLRLVAGTLHVGRGLFRAVQCTFVDLYQKGLIYRGKRMVNWDPVALTALSDEEVIRRRRKARSITSATSWSRSRENSSRSPPLGRKPSWPTSRWRCIPNDERYRASLGKQVWRPLGRARAVRLSAMERSIRNSAPACSESDAGARQTRLRDRSAARSAGYRRPASERHDQLSRRRSSTGLDRFEARKKAAEQLAGARPARKEEPHENNVGFSERADVPIEPRLSEQWFLKYPRAEGSACRGRIRREDSLSSRSAGKRSTTLAGEHPGLVHQPSALVGPSHSGLVSKQEAAKPRQSHPRRHRAAIRRGKLEAGSRRARHLVFELALAV